MISFVSIKSSEPKRKSAGERERERQRDRETERQRARKAIQEKVSIGKEWRKVICCESC